MWEHPRTQPVHTQSAVAQSHYSACYWPLSHSAAQHWISQPRPVSLPLWGIDWLHDFLRCSSHTLSLSLTLHCPQCSVHAVYLSSVPLHSHLPVYLSCSFVLSFCPSCSSSLSLVLSLSPSLSAHYSPGSFSGQQNTLFSSLLSTAMAKLPIHLLRLLYSLLCLQNPLQLQSLHE